MINNIPDIYSQQLVLLIIKWVYINNHLINIEQQLN